MGGEEFKMESDDGFIMNAFVRIQDGTLPPGGERVEFDCRQP